MGALSEIQALKQQAIDLLLNERELIDHELKQLGYGQENAPLGKKRGRKSKEQSTLSVVEDLPRPSSHFEKTPAVLL